MFVPFRWGGVFFQYNKELVQSPKNNFAFCACIMVIIVDHTEYLHIYFFFDASINCKNILK